METFLIKAAQLILAFAILVIIHEFGHFLFARIFGVKVEKFYIFFDPWFKIFKWYPKRYFGFGKKTIPMKRHAGSGEDGEKAADENAGGRKSFFGNTEYGIGWLPLGGYCKIAGMIDESMDTEQLKSEPQPWEFRSKPAWQRLLIMVAGVLFNFILAIVIYAGLVYATGEQYVPFDKAGMGMAYSDEAKKIGFEDGDIPLAADGEKLSYPGDARIKMIQAKEVTVMRNGGDTARITIPADFMLTLDAESKRPGTRIQFMTYRIPAQVIQVMPGEGADKGGVKEGDRILSIDGSATPTLDAFFKQVADKGNKTVALALLRNNKDTITANVRMSENSKMGIALEVNPGSFYPVENKTYNLLQSVPRGIEMGIDKLTSYAASMKLVFTKEGAKSVGGFGAIGSIFPEKWDWTAFWNVAAFLSVALAFMNILPIPALDGGHVLFLLFEVIFRRQPPQKFMEWAQMTGMALLILLLIYANGMDIVRLFK